MTQKAKAPGNRKIKRPEFDLPGPLLDVIKTYIGPRKINKLTTEEAIQLTEACNELAQLVGKIMKPTITTKRSPLEYIEDPLQVKRVEVGPGEE